MNCRSSVKEKAMASLLPPLYTFFSLSFSSSSSPSLSLLLLRHSLWHSHTNSHRLRANVPQCNRAARNWICCKLLPLSRASVARGALRVALVTRNFSYNCLSHPRLSIDSTVWRGQLQFQISLILSASLLLFVEIQHAKMRFELISRPILFALPPSCNASLSISPSCAVRVPPLSGLSCIAFWKL